MARAAALQAVGQGFESPYLQNRNGCRKGWGFEGRAAHREYDEKRALIQKLDNDGSGMIVVRRDI